MEDAPFIDGLGGEDPQRGVGKDRDEAPVLVEGLIFVVPKDDNATFGVVYIVISVAFDP